jgi:hypothetical protein
MTDPTPGKTATQVRQDENELSALHKTFEAFLNQWKPEDRCEASRFEADLFMLVRAIHADAAKPMEKALTASLSAMPPMIFAHQPHCDQS